MMVMTVMMMMMVMMMRRIGIDDDIDEDTDDIDDDVGDYWPHVYVGISTVHAVYQSSGRPHRCVCVCESEDARQRRRWAIPKVVSSVSPALPARAPASLQ